MVSKTLSILELLDNEELYKYSDDLFNKFLKIAVYEGMNPVSELELGDSFNLEDVRRAFKRLARMYHPDVSSVPDAEERFKRINHAYQTIMDRPDYYIKNQKDSSQEKNQYNDGSKKEYQQSRSNNDYKTEGKRSDPHGESWSDTFKKQEQYQRREKRGLSDDAVREIKTTIIDNLMKSQAFQEIYSTKLFYRYYQFLIGQPIQKPDISHYRKVFDQALKKLKASENIPLWWDHKNSQDIINVIAGARYKSMPIEIAIRAVENILLSI